jgi:hypothetical protein
MDFVKYGSRPKPKPFSGQQLRAAARCEIKLNGHRMTLVKRLDGSWYAAGRKPELNQWREVRPCLEGSLIWSLLMCAPAASVFDGELYFDGPETSVVTRLKEGQPLLFSPFSIPYFAGRDLRFKPWCDTDAAFSALGWPLPHVIASRRLGCDWRSADLVAEARRLGIEGFVLKEFPYSRWWKTKPTASIDLIVVGTQPGKGKTAGRIGALQLALYDGTDMGGVGSGRDEEWRDEDPASVIGRVVQVEFDSYAANGKLKFPRFHSWRDDKKPSECIADQC